MSDLAAALQIAIKVHADQRDKQGEPYLLHVLRVVEAVSDEAKVVAALHDVAEDGGGGYAGFPDDVFSRCGLAMWETFALEALTHDSADTYGEYIDKLICDRLGMDVAREVKLADLRDNLGAHPENSGHRAIEHRLVLPQSPLREGHRSPCGGAGIATWNTRRKTA